jgi:hypothetical protein
MLLGYPAMAPLKPCASCGHCQTVWGRRQKYVDEQMEKRMGVKKDDPSQARGGPMDPEQQLYITPDELKVWALAFDYPATRGPLSAYDLGNHALFTALDLQSLALCRIRGDELCATVVLRRLRQSNRRRCRARG